MLRPVVAYVATLVVFLAMDAAYLGTVGAKMFKATLGDVLAPSFKILPVAIFYPAYALGLLFLAVLPALASDRWTQALATGAALGLFAYGTYDLTNWATVRNWTPTLTIADMAWGTFVSAAASTAAFFIARAVSSNG